MNKNIRMIAAGLAIGATLTASTAVLAAESRTGLGANVQPETTVHLAVTVEQQSKNGTVITELDSIIQPWGLAFAPDGGMIVSSAGGNQISKWKDNKLEQLTSLTKAGYYDGTTANSLFNQPTFTAVNSKGVIYVSDTENHVVRRITGTRVYTAAGDGMPGRKDGKFGEAQFHAPAGIVIDAADNVYVADSLNHVIRKITPEGVTTTVAGKASDTGGYKDGALAEAAFNEPTGLALDGKGGLYVADSGNHLIRYILDGKVTTVAGTPTELDDFGYMVGGYRNGASEDARFNRPRGLAYADGVLFIADSLNNRIRALQADGEVVTLAGHTVPGNAIGAAVEARFNQPSALLYAAGKLYIADTLNNSVKTLRANPRSLQPIMTEEDMIAQVELLPAASEPQLWLDGKQIELLKGLQAFTQGDQQYVPVRAVLEAWGSKVKWDVKQKQAAVTKGDWSIKLKANTDGSVLLLKSGMYISTAYLQQVAPLLIVQDEEYNAIIMGSTI